MTLSLLDPLADATEVVLDKSGVAHRPGSSCPVRSTRNTRMSAGHARLTDHKSCPLCHPYGGSR